MGTGYDVSFTAVPRTGGPPPLTVRFNDTSNFGTATILEWHWDFGDDHTSMVPRPSHTYSDYGDYTVSLSLVTSEGTYSLSEPDFVSITGPLPANNTQGLVILFVAVGLGAVAVIWKRSRVS